MARYMAVRATVETIQSIVLSFEDDTGLTGSRGLMSIIPTLDSSASIKVQNNLDGEGQETHHPDH
jgi:hypothetical protein